MTLALILILMMVLLAGIQLARVKPIPGTALMAASSVLFLGMGLYAAFGPSSDHALIVDAELQRGANAGSQLAVWVATHKPGARVWILTRATMNGSTLEAVHAGFVREARKQGVVMAGESTLEMPSSMVKHMEHAFAEWPEELRIEKIQHEIETSTTWQTWELIEAYALNLVDRADYVLCMHAPMDPPMTHGAGSLYTGPPLLIFNLQDPDGSMFSGLRARGVVAVAAVRGEHGDFILREETP